MAKLTRCAQTGRLRDMEAEEKKYREGCERHYAAVRRTKEAEINRICARYELESDEFFTRREKALRILGR